MTLVVNTPAVTASVSHVMSARSALGPLARIAAYMPGAESEGQEVKQGYRLAHVQVGLGVRKVRGSLKMHRDFLSLS